MESVAGCSPCRSALRPSGLAAMAALCLVGHAAWVWAAPEAAAQTAPLQQAIDVTEQTQRAAARSQQTVQAADDQTQAMLEKYRSALWQAQQLEVYVQQLQELAQSQQDERASIERQLTDLERADRELMPLMLRMIDALAGFVDQDLPFLREERTQRIANLRRLMADASSSTAERFRAILDAYRVEIDYGRSLGSERIDIDGRVHEQLRIGRVALFAIAPDGADALRWDAASSTWQALGARDARAIREGLKVARETTAPQLLVLPMPTPTATPVSTAAATAAGDAR